MTLMYMRSGGVMLRDVLYAHLTLMLIIFLPALKIHQET